MAHFAVCPGLNMARVPARRLTRPGVQSRVGALGGAQLHPSRNVFE